MARIPQRVGWVGFAFAGLSWVILILWVTGLGMFLLPVSELLDMTVVESMTRRLCAVTHGVGTWVLCVLCGRGVWPHVLLMWRQRHDRRQWSWGVLNLCVIVVLALSGLMLLYGSPQLHERLALVHWGLGMVAPLPWVIHAWRRWFPLS